MKKLVLELADDDTFNARLSIDGVVTASVSGNRSVCTVMGAVDDFAEVLRVMSGQRWQRAQVEGAPWIWQAFYASNYGNSFWLPDGNLLFGFESEAATISAAARLKAMYPALVKAPGHLYEAFHTDAEGWGFFDRAGLLHATFPSRQDAEAVAQVERAKVTKPVAMPAKRSVQPEGSKA